MSRPLLEFGGGSGEILRDLLHLRSVSEAEALISGAEGRDQLRHISTSLQAPEPLGRFEAAGGCIEKHGLVDPRRSAPSVRVRRRIWSSRRYSAT